jgi:hypothetical protein
MVQNWFFDLKKEMMVVSDNSSQVLMSALKLINLFQPTTSAILHHGQPQLDFNYI